MSALETMVFSRLKAERIQGCPVWRGLEMQGVLSELIRRCLVEPEDHYGSMRETVWSDRQRDQHAGAADPKAQYPPG